MTRIKAWLDALRWRIILRLLPKGLEVPVDWLPTPPEWQKLWDDIYEERDPSVQWTANRYYSSLEGRVVGKRLLDHYEQCQQYRYLRPYEIVDGPLGEGAPTDPPLSATFRAFVLSKVRTFHAEGADLNTAWRRVAVICNRNGMNPEGARDLVELTYGANLDPVNDYGIVARWMQQQNEPANEKEVSDMSKLTSKQRAALPKSSFGEPGKKAYPMPDASHAANAKARATQAVNSGRMAPATAAKIDAKANRVMGKKGK